MVSQYCPKYGRSIIRRKGVIRLRKRRNCVKEYRGFTLIELIVTMAVSAILLSAAVAGIAAWVHHADFVRNENYAETIYYAAQAELTRYRGNGQLAELKELMRSADADAAIMGQVPVYDVTDDYRASLTAAGGSDLAEYNEHYKDRLYYLKKDEGPIGENNPLGGLLSDYIYDGSIMEGAVCVEFDPSDGTVYSVTYSDKNAVFTYDEASGEKEFSLKDRTKGVREKSRVGYYSTELSAASPTAVGKTRVAEVQLINEEQLYFKWSLPGQFDGIRKFLSYTIEIYDKAGNGRPAYTFVLKGKDLKETDTTLNIRSEAGGIAPGYIVTANGKDAGDNEVSYQFIAYHIGSEMYLVLDSIDYGADPEAIGLNTGTEGGFDTKSLKNSASILQLFPEPKDIYIRIQAQGKPYKTSAWKQSNASNTLFAAMKEEGGGLFGTNATKDIYEIKNARHLYNIRYRERENELTPRTKDTYYRQTADVAWPVEENRLFHSTAAGAGAQREMKPGLLQEGDRYPAGAAYFPAIPVLGEGSVLEAEKGRNYELKNFILYQAETREGASAEKKLGLMETNRGTVQGLTITGITVQGVQNAGAVCGINEGNGRVLNTAVSGTVNGKENIGGLVGLDRAASDLGMNPAEDELKNKSAYRDLTNYADITGSNGKVGGIVGSLGEKGQAYRCENYGAVKGTQTGTVYIGGITGYNKGLVQSCVSAPDDTPPGKQGEGELEQAALNGIFVGGIVGCNNGGTIRDSGTEKETKDMSGTGGDAYVIGCRYVGGIVGYNNSAVDGGTAGTLVNRQDRTNKAKVIGHDYVGGIVGANGLLEDNNIIEDKIRDDKTVYINCKVVEKYSAKMIVEDWVNEGIVEAVGAADSSGAYTADGRYAGGVAGYNAGDLKNCTTRINTSSGDASDLIDQVRLYGKNASYVGGVAGCNVGYIYRDGKTVSVSSVVSGKKYVGGIVGYNGSAAAADDSNPDNSGRISNYELSGGNIYAESYAGGYAGLNTTKKLLSGPEGAYMLKANPNEVKADCFAGGVMGALILTPENSDAITVNCTTENFFGKVEAEYGFAGGYAGYTQLLRSGDAVERAEALYSKVTAEGIKGNIESTDAAVKQAAIQKLAETVLDERQNTGMDHDGAWLQFIYEGDAGESRFAEVNAPVFAGGVIGANSWHTKLLLQNIHNKVRVSAADTVTYDFISAAANTKDGGALKKDTFSFAGGIIGLVTPNAVVDSCSNSGAGSADGKGTYGGGIAEVNLGTIRNCTAGSASGRSYYGGIVGLNTNDGIVENCVLDGQISGSSYLGGIAACNESIIKTCTVLNSTGAAACAVIGTGEYIGGIAAVNRIKRAEETTAAGTVTTSGANQITGCEVKANIGMENTGAAVGGLVGRYEGGSLKGSRVTAADIYGQEKVGGIAGEIRSNLAGEEITNSGGSRDKDIVNNANVHAAKAAGGIGGALLEKAGSAGMGAPKDVAKVIHCRNNGKISATAGYAGGIVPEIPEGGTVENCLNTGSVEAVNAEAGGITAANSGRIVSCVVWGDIPASPCSIKGKERVGGIAGTSSAGINNCTLQGNVKISDVSASGTGKMIGGFAGYNTGTIINPNAAKDDGGSIPEISTFSQESYLGGVAGCNMQGGAIQGAGTVMLNVVLDGGRRGTVGGIAGANGGIVSGKDGEITFSGTVKGTANSLYGTGGIVGRNEALNGEKGTVSHCIVSGGTVEAESGDTGFAGHTETQRGVYVGGICGVNPEGGTIEHCFLRDGSRVSGDYGYVGGIVAFNLGKVRETKPAEKDTSVVTISNRGNKGKCVAGGIAAYNGAAGELENCTTGTGWTITNQFEDEYCPTGGIIGCNKSIYDQKNLTNNAAVNGGYMTGGVIGQQQTELQDGFTIEKCENNGTVIGVSHSAGGIVSDWRNRSGRVRECINRANVSIQNSSSGAYWNGAAGIIGTGWWGSAVSITIERCGNEGTINYKSGSAGALGKAAGIFGDYNNNSSLLTLTVTDCYNAGIIQNLDGRSAGIAALPRGTGSNYIAEITRCVNYGKGSDKNNYFAGIAAGDYSGNNKVTVSRCLNVGECCTKQYPIAEKLAAGSENYYFSNSASYNERFNPNNAKTQVAERKGSWTWSGWKQDNYFTETNGAAFLNTDNRLILPDGNKYIQFSDVDMGTTGNAGISGKPDNISNPNSPENPEHLKEAFSALNYPTWRAGDPYALLLYGMKSGSLGAPTKVVLTETDQGYRVTYEPDVWSIFCTEGYEVVLEGSKTGKWDNPADINTLGSPVTVQGAGRNTTDISAADLPKEYEQTYKWVRARVRAKKASGYYDITTENNSGFSPWSEPSNAIGTAIKLPAPQVHFEVRDIGAADQMCGDWVLDNAADYEKYGDSWIAEVTVEANTDLGDTSDQTVTFQKNVSRAEMRFTVNRLGGNGESNRDMKACAKPNPGDKDAAALYRDSDALHVMLDWYSKEETIKAANEGKGGFAGTEAGQLSYQFELTQVGMGNYPYTDVTYKAELLLGSESLGEGTVNVPASSKPNKNATCTIDLSGRTEAEIRELIDSINGVGVNKAVEVRAYPWEMRDLVRYYYVTTNADGTTTITPTINKNNGGTFNNSYVSFSLKDLTGYGMYPAPQPGGGTDPKKGVVSTTDEQGGITYFLYWDGNLKKTGDGSPELDKDGNIIVTPLSGSDYADAKYEVSVTGITGTGTEVLLKSETTTGRYIRLPENNWKYNRLRLKVKRLGSESAGGTSGHYIGASAEKTYEIPIRLSSVAMPDVTRRDNDSLVFQVNWATSAENGVGGYQIVMKGKDGAGRDIGTAKISIDGKEISKNFIDLDDLGDNVTNVSGEELSPDEREAWKEARYIEFSIIVRSENPDEYLDSAESPKISLEIPERLKMPEMTSKLLYHHTEVDTDGAMEPNAFSEFVLQVEAPADTSLLAAYAVEYFVSGKPNDDGTLTVWDQTANDGSGGYVRWNADPAGKPEKPALDAEHGIYISNGPVNMGGDLRSGDYALNQPGDFDAEQAGRTLWYRVRAVSGNMISSPWTVWERKELPKALLEPVEEISGEKTVIREYDYSIEGTSAPDGGSNRTSVEQPKVGFMPAEFAKGYEIYILGAARKEWVYDEEKDEMIQKDVEPEKWTYTLEEADRTPDGTEPKRPFILKENGAELDDGMPDESDIDILQVETSGSGTTYVYTLYQVVHSYKLENTQYIYRIPVDAKLCYRTKDGGVQEIWLELPEGETIINNRPFVATSLVDVTVIAPDAGRYVINDLRRWRRVEDGEEKTESEVMSVEEAGKDRPAVTGYYEDMLYPDEMSDLQLRMFGLEREELSEKDEEADKSDVSGNDVSGNDMTSGDDTEKKVPVKPESGRDERAEEGKEEKPEGGGTEEKPPAKPEDSRDEIRESSNTSEEETPEDGTGAKKSKGQNSGGERV